MDREAIYEIIEEGKCLDVLQDLSQYSEKELVKLLIEIGKEEEESLETGIDWDWARKDLDDQEWYDNDSGDEERQVYLGTVFSVMPSGKYYLPFACSNVESCPVCKGETEYGEMTCGICRGEGKRGIHPDDDVSTFDLVNVGQQCTSCNGTGKTGIPCDYCGSLGSREAHLDSLMQKKLEEEAGVYNLFITSGEGNPCDIMTGEIR